MPHLVSIVVPAYNAAKRIEPTLLSLAAQDYANIEIIVVDDGSSDGTSGLAESVLKKTGRDFKIIRHETNMGVSAARNTSFGAVSGDYMIFFDSDDLADQNFVSVLLDTITQNDSDIAFCCHRYRRENTGEEQPGTLGLDPSRKYSVEELTMMYIDNKIYSLICAAIFKTNFLKTTGLKFTVGCTRGEDIEFLTKIFSQCKSINFHAGCHYIYVKHEDQATRTSWRELPMILVTQRKYREAKYLAEHAISPRVRELARNYLLPKELVKTLTLAAQDCDKEKFYSTLREPETRCALKACFRNLLRKPELVLKAITLLTAPGLYYRIRSKPRKQM